MPEDKHPGAHNMKAQPIILDRSTAREVARPDLKTTPEPAADDTGPMYNLPLVLFVTVVILLALACAMVKP